MNCSICRVFNPSGEAVCLFCRQPLVGWPAVKTAAADADDLVSFDLDPQALKDTDCVNTVPSVTRLHTRPAE